MRPVRLASALRLVARVALRSCSTSAGETVLWHNPDCSKSRAAMALLEKHGIPFTVREYLKEPPSFSELKALQAQLGSPFEWVRHMDDAWCEHFDNATVYDDILPDDEDILRAIANTPIMMERPILSHRGQSIVGRPHPERIMELLEATAPSSSATSKDALPEGLEDMPSTPALVVVKARLHVNQAAANALARGADAAEVESKLLQVAAELNQL